VNSLHILYQDQYYISIDKPSGLLTIPDGYDRNLPNLKSMLIDEFGSVWTVHRLDKETSGVIIFALSADAHKKLSVEFEERKIIKEYRALITGVLDSKNVNVALPLRVNGDRRHRTVVDQVNGKPSFIVINGLRSHGSF